MKFHLRVYDNYHYTDESEAYNHGEYETYEEALCEAKAIVYEFLEQNWERGIIPEDLIAIFSLYGEDPIILPNEPGENEIFSAKAYAEDIAIDICRKL
ncbi:MAG: hypothetical protein ACOYMF_07010 [Bacteroidales bacterium]